MTATPATAATLSPTPRSTLGRHAERGRTDRAELHDVLDAGLVCHLGFVADGAPVVLPTAYGRDGDVLYLHGSSGAGYLMREELPACVTVTHLDGLVHARAVFSFSMNYRSAVAHGTARPVTDDSDDGEKLRALRTIVEHLTPGAWEHARPPTRRELAATTVLALDLGEASVKVRSGPPADDDADVTADAAWAGVLPVRTVLGTPEPAPDLATPRAVPEHVARRAEHVPG